MKGRHKTRKQNGDPTFSAKWSGVTYAPTCAVGHCPQCGKHLHHEAGEHYCPYCDDFVRPIEHCNGNN